MDYRPKFRFQWTWDGYNLIPLNPKAEEVLSRVHCAGEVSGLPLSHSSFIKSFPPVYEGRWPTFWNGKEWEEVQPTGKGTWVGRSWENSGRFGLNVRPYPRLGIDTDWGPSFLNTDPEGINIQPHPRLGVWMNDYKIDHRFGTID